jgi:hypothetical protein
MNSIHSGANTSPPPRRLIHDGEIGVMFHFDGLFTSSRISQIASSHSARSATRLKISSYVVCDGFGRPNSCGSGSSRSRRRSVSVTRWNDCNPSWATFRARNVTNVRRYGCVRHNSSTDWPRTVSCCAVL